MDMFWQQKTMTKDFPKGLLPKAYLVLLSLATSESKGFLPYLGIVWRNRSVLPLSKILFGQAKLVSANRCDQTCTVHNTETMYDKNES